MALIGALYSTLNGLQNTEARINVLSQNVTNADKPGYTRKELETKYATVNDTVVAVGSQVATVNYNPYLLETLIEDTSIASQSNVISNYLSEFIGQYGSVAGENNVGSYANELAASLDRLAISPEDDSLKNQVVSNAGKLANELNRLSGSIQDYRSRADQDIEQTVNQINTSVSLIDDLNSRIVALEAVSKSTSNLEDERRVELEKLSSLVNISYFVNQKNEVQIYTGGRPLLDSIGHTIEYNANTALDKNTVYPAGFNAIDLEGFDLTPFIRGGELGGLINVRDTQFVNEQAKLDEYANVLMTQLNALQSSGASIPGPAQVTGSVTGVATGDAFSATGSIRIAVLDETGTVQNFADFNLAGYPTIANLNADINATLGADVSVIISPPNGQWQISADNPGTGIAINQLDSDVAPDNVTFSQYFGLNNMFDGTGADNIKVSDYLANNGNNLATSRLESGALAIGDFGVNIGDSSLSSEMNDVFTSSYSFAAAGTFPSQSETLNNFIDKIISDTAFRASNAASDASITLALMEQTKSTLENMSAVNIDEEMANLIDLEAKYEASATMIATIQQMFDTLLAAVR